MRSRRRPPQPKPPSDAEQLSDRLHSAAIHLLRRLRREDDASGLTAPRMSVLSVLVFVGPKTLGELARSEQVRAPTMTRLVAGLESQGLVRREPDARDRRVVRIHATARGDRILREGRRRRVEALAARVEGLTDEERRTLGSAAELLERITRE